MTKQLAPVSPGEILFEEFLTPLGMSKYRLAKSIGVPAKPHRRHCIGQARHHRRHRFAPLPLLRPYRRLVAQTAGGLRHETRKEGAGWRIEEDHATGAGGVMGNKLQIPSSVIGIIHHESQTSSTF